MSGLDEADIQIEDLPPKPSVEPTDQFAVDDKDGKTWKVLASQILDYVDGGGSTNVTRIYVNSEDGIDSPSRGNAIEPYQTINYALSQITDASESKIYLIDAYGDFSESDFSIRPYIIFNFNSGSFTVSNAVSMDASFSSGGISLIQNLYNFNLPNGASLSFSLAPLNGFRVYFKNVNFDNSSTISLLSTANSIPDIRFINCRTNNDILNTAIISENCDITFQNSSFSSLNHLNNIFSSKINASGSNFNGFLLSASVGYVECYINSSIVNGVQFQSSGSGAVIVHSYGNDFLNPLFFDGANVYYDGDTLNYVPILINGARYLPTAKSFSIDSNRPSSIIAIDNATLTNPCPAIVYIHSLSAGGYVKLPPVQETESLQIGQSVSIVIGQPSQPISIQDSSGSSIGLPLQEGISQTFTLDANDTPEGTWAISTLNPLMFPGTVIAGDSSNSMRLSQISGENGILIDTSEDGQIKIDGSEKMDKDANLADVADEILSRANIGIGTGSVVLNLNQDYVLVNPPTKNIILNIPTPSHSVNLYPTGIPGSLEEGEIITITSEQTSQSVLIRDENGINLVEINPNEKYIAEFVGTSLLPPTGWYLRKISGAGFTPTMQDTYDAGSTINLTDGKAISITGGSTIIGAQQLLVQPYSNAVNPTAASTVFGIAFTALKSGYVTYLCYADPVFTPATGTRQVGLYQYTNSSTGILLATANISKTDPLDAGTSTWRIFELPIPVALSAGTRYALGVLTPNSDNHLFYQCFEPAFADIDGGNYPGVLSATLVYPSGMQNWLGAGELGNANLIFQDSLNEPTNFLLQDSTISTTFMKVDSAIQVTRPFTVMTQSQINALSGVENYSIVANDTIEQYQFYFGGWKSFAVESQVLPLSGGTLTGALILSGIPSSSNQAATKSYVDDAVTAALQGLNYHNDVYAITLTDFGSVYNNGASGVGATLTALSNGIFSADGVSVPIGERVLIASQTLAQQNGIYIVTDPGSVSTVAILTRSSDYDTVPDISPGDLVPVINGNTQFGSTWRQTQDVVTIGTDPISFVIFNNSPASYLKVANNLSDLSSIATARSNLGLVASAIIDTTDASNISSGILGNSRTTATSLNTNDSIVLRDPSGDFSANNITANLIGNSDTTSAAATNAIATNAEFYPLFVSSAVDSNQIMHLDTSFTYNPSTDRLSLSGLTLTKNGLGATNFFRLGDLSRPVDEKYWNIYPNGGSLLFTAMNDAFTATTPFMQVNRSSGTGISSVFINNGTFGVSSLLANQIISTNASKVLTTLANPLSYTPTIGDGTNNFVTSTAIGQYYQLANLYIVSGQVIWTSKGSATPGTQARISLPIAIGANNARVSIGIGLSTGVTFTGQELQGAGTTGNAYFSFTGLSNAGATSNVNVSQFNTSGELNFTAIFWSN